jgi:hypothetical protein
MLDGMASRCPRSGQRKLPGERPGHRNFAGHRSFLFFCFVNLSVSRRSTGANIIFARLSDLSLRTALSEGSLSRTGACLHASRSRVCCFEPVFFPIQRRSFSIKIQCCSLSICIYIYKYMLPRIFLAVTALSGFFCEFEPGCGDRDTSMLFNFRNCWRPTCSVCMLHCSQAVERSLSFFQRPARCGAASVTFVTSRDL